MGAQDVQGVGLADAVQAIRADLEAAQVAGQGADLRFPVQKVTVVLQVVATRSGEGRVGFRVPFAGVEVGGTGSASSQRTSTVTVEFAAPVDRTGQPVRIAGEGSGPKG